jgi:hypothetical protein
MDEHSIRIREIAISKENNEGTKYHDFSRLSSSSRGSGGSIVDSSRKRNLEASGSDAVRAQ